MSSSVAFCEWNGYGSDMQAELAQLCTFHWVWELVDYLLVGGKKHKLSPETVLILLNAVAHNSH